MLETITPLMWKNPGIFCFSGCSQESRNVQLRTKTAGEVCLRLASSLPPRGRLSLLLHSGFSSLPLHQTRIRRPCLNLVPGNTPTNRADCLSNGNKFYRKVWHDIDSSVSTGLRVSLFKLYHALKLLYSHPQPLQFVAKAQQYHSFSVPTDIQLRTFSKDPITKPTDNNFTLPVVFCFKNSFIPNNRYFFMHSIYDWNIGKLFFLPVSSQS